MALICFFFCCSCVSFHLNETDNKSSAVSNIPKENFNSFSYLIKETSLNVVSLAVSKNGILYFSNFGSPSKIGKIDLKQGSEPLLFVDLAEWIDLTQDLSPSAEGMGVDDSGHLLIAESGTGKLLRISADARKLEVLADSYDGYRFSSVKDLAIGSDGDLFVSSPLSGTIYRIIPEKGYVGVLNMDLVMAEGLCISPDGNKLIAAEPEAGRLVVYNMPDELLPVSSWTLVDFSPSEIAPKSLTFDQAGRLYVLIPNENEIKVFDLNDGKQITSLNLDAKTNSIACFQNRLFVAVNDGIQVLDISHIP